MAKRPRRPRTPPLSAEAKRMRQWRSCGVVTLVGVLALVVFYVVLKFFRDDHAHKPAPHGGVVASVEDGEGHHHVEAVVEKGGTLRLYTFGDDLDRLQDVESQVLAAQVKREGDAELTPVDLMPMPRATEPDGRTSEFFGKLPREARSGPLLVRITGIEIDYKRFPLEFVLPASAHHGEPDDQARDEENLSLTAGGKYTEADLAANGRQTVSARYKAFRVEHDMKPRRGERTCPITRIKANQEFTWVVSGKTYEFCCPPCIDQFLRRAKDEPQAIRDPELYVKK